MRLRGAIKQVDLKSCAGTVIPNINPLEYDEESEVYFYFKNVDLPDAQKAFLVPGLQVFFSVAQDAYGQIEIVNIVPATVGRYCARCTMTGSHKVFIPDLRIAAKVDLNSAFELGGVDNFLKQDKILVRLTWDEIIESQKEQRVPMVEASGTLMARGYPFLTDSTKQFIRDNYQQEKNEFLYKPFEKIERPVAYEDTYGRRARPRSKSVDGKPSVTWTADGAPDVQAWKLYADEANCNNTMANPNHALFSNRPQPMIPASLGETFYNPYAYVPSPYTNGFPCNCHR